MNIKIITGMNNTGKTVMFNYFEKLGYLCHNNFPAKFLFDYIKKEEIKTTSSKNLLFVIDCRSETEFNTLLNAIKYLKNLNCDVSLIYLDSSNEVLINRYKEIIHEMITYDNPEDIIERLLNRNKLYQDILIKIKEMQL